MVPPMYCKSLVPAFDSNRVTAAGSLLSTIVQYLPSTVLSNLNGSAEVERIHGPAYKALPMYN